MSENQVSVRILIEVGDDSGEAVRTSLSFLAPLGSAAAVNLGDVTQLSYETALDEWVEIVANKERFEEVMSVSPSSPGVSDPAVSENIKKRRVL